MRNNNNGFSLVEILIVVGVLGIILTISTLSFSHVRNKSLDARRESDVQEIRSALEQYRSTTNYYPTPVPDSSGLPFGESGLRDSGSNVYMQRIPQDPFYPKKTYLYEGSGSDYTLYAHLEYPGKTECSIDTPKTCGETFLCNYCFGPYGPK